MRQEKEHDSQMNITLFTCDLIFIKKTYTDKVTTYLEELILGLINYFILCKLYIRCLNNGRTELP